ncbi:hypothetical protein TNCV_4786961 [Trichonephila clavipes]|nr:hypothetical protein TNCV_4786961 [Trichonephila clavipes]
MVTPGSSFIPTPLGHEDNLEVRYHPRANTLQRGIHQTIALDYSFSRCLVPCSNSLCGCHTSHQKSLMDRISIHFQNLDCHKRESFLDHLKSGDEKWIMYKHVVRKKGYVYKGKTPPSTFKSGVHQRKVILGYWTATAGSDVVQTGRPIFDYFFQHLWPYIGSNTANVAFQMVKCLWLIRIDQ